MDGFDTGGQRVTRVQNRLCSCHKHQVLRVKQVVRDKQCRLQDKKSSAGLTGKPYGWHLKIRSFALSDIGTSGGNVRVSFQFITFLYVS